MRTENFFTIKQCYLTFFLCLLYLMVLSNSPISAKSIDMDGRANELSNNITNLDENKHPNIIHKKLNQKYKKDKSNKQLNISKTTKLYSQARNTSNKISTFITTRTADPKKHKSFRKNIIGFWRKPKGKDKQIAQKKEYKNKKSRRKRTRSKRVYLRRKQIQDRNTDISGPSNVNVFKRDTKTRLKTKAVSTVRIGITPQTIAVTKPTSKKHHCVTKPIVKNNDDLNVMITTMTTQLAGLKKKYRLNSYATVPISFAYNPVYRKLVSAGLDHEPTRESDFLGTAQIEALLNDIKFKTRQMIAANNASVSDMITNTVTEPTYEADPFLTHLQSKSSQIENFVAINDVHNGKRKAKEATSNDSMLNYVDPYRIADRSLKDDAITIAQSVEDRLQNELKSIYNKVKGKITDISTKKTNKCKPAIKTTTAKLAKKIKTQTIFKKPSSSGTTKPINKMTSPDSARITESKTRMLITTSTGSPIDILPTLDDFMMLTLYEQMLQESDKGSEKRVTTTELPMKKIKKRELLKRNQETLMDLKSKEELTGDDAPLPDDLDDLDLETITSVETSPTSTSEITSELIQDASYNTLSEMMSYRDYVNGYKHYLKFQKDLGDEKFSAMVKYQAHKHHKVDDIGKYILDKIPPMPTYQSRSPLKVKRFFDDTDIDDQEISTKNDDSWFKKHFYLFIDNGPPRKYHTSETISLKLPVSGTAYTSNNKIKSIGSKEHIFSQLGDDAGNNCSSRDYVGTESTLEDLSKALGVSKGSKLIATIAPGNLFTNKTTTSALDLAFSNGFTNMTDITSSKTLPYNLIDKLFGCKYRRTPKNIKRQSARSNRLKRANYENSNADYFLTKNEVELTATPNKENLNDTDMHRKQKDNHKYGYVDVKLLMPKATAVLKRRENTTKRSKLKELLNKFHFKGSKNKKKDKRACTNRYPRFNPFQKIKDIFKAKAEETIIPNKPSRVDFKMHHSYQEDSHFKPQNNLPGDEIANTHKNAFKPIKYSKSIEDIKKQVPNISAIDGDDDTTQLPRQQKIVEILQPTPYFLKLNKKDQEILYTKPKSTTHSTTKQYNIATSRKIVNSRTDLTKTMTTFSNLPLKYKDTSFVTKEVTPTTALRVSPQVNKACITLADLKVELDNIQYRLAKTKELPKNIVQLQESPEHITIPVAIVTRPLGDFIIKSKLTRFAKFPLPDFENTHKGLRRRVVKDNAVNDVQRNVLKGKSISNKKNKEHVAAETTVKFDALTNNNLKFHNKYKQFDYFNDLLRWHNDILNVETGTNEFWRDIIRNIQHDIRETFTTPNIDNIMNELKELNVYVDQNINNASYVPVYAVNDYNTGDRAMVRSVALNDKALVKSKDLMIKGEAKYYEYNQPIDLDPVKISAKNQSHIELPTFTTRHVTRLINKEIPMSKDRSFIARDWIDRNIPEAKIPLEHYNMITERYTTHMAPMVTVKLVNGLPITERPFGIELFTMKDVGRAFTRRVSSATSTPPLMIDTAPLSYFDEVESATEDIDMKKLSRNSETWPLQNEFIATDVAMTKSIKQPLHCFSTPLPMQPKEFDKFLKEHDMDVKSLTAPLNEMTPSNIDPWKLTKRTTVRTKMANALTVANIINSIMEKKPHDSLQHTNLKGTDNSQKMKFKNKIISDAILVKGVTKKPILVKYNKKVVNAIYRQNVNPYTKFNLEDFNHYRLRKKLKVDKTVHNTNEVDSSLNSRSKLSRNEAERARVTNKDGRNKAVDVKVLNIKNNNKNSNLETKTVIPSIRVADEGNIKINDESLVDSDIMNEYIGQSVHNKLLYTYKSNENEDRLYAKTKYPALTIHHTATNIFNPMIHMKKIQSKNPMNVQISSRQYNYDMFYGDNTEVPPVFTMIPEIQRI